MTSVYIPELQYQKYVVIIHECCSMHVNGLTCAFNSMYGTAQRKLDPCMWVADQQNPSKQVWVPANILNRDRQHSSGTRNQEPVTPV